jgi:hypothetical protein
MAVEARISCFELVAFGRCLAALPPLIFRISDCCDTLAPVSVFCARRIFFSPKLLCLKMVYFFYVLVAYRYVRL